METSDEPKLIRVTFEYEDRYESLYDDDARNWFSAANGMAMLNSVHGNPFPQFSWNIHKKHLEHCLHPYNEKMMICCKDKKLISREEVKHEKQEDNT